jgi:hypothetical protein
MKETGRFRVRGWYDFCHGFHCYDYIEIEKKSITGNVSWGRDWEDGYSGRGEDDIRLSLSEWYVKTHPGFVEVENEADDRGEAAERGARAVARFGKEEEKKTYKQEMKENKLWTIIGAIVAGGSLVGLVCFRLFLR